MGRRLRAAGHECWTAYDAGLSAAGDDDLTVYAHDQRAVLVTHDVEFSKRRRRNVIGWHVQMRCREWEAADLLIRHLDYVQEQTTRFQDIWIAISHEGAETAHGWR